MSGTIYKSYTMLTNPPDGFTVSIDPSSLTISQQALFAAPPPIGSTTPNTGAFTTLSATTPIKPASGGTGSNAIPGAGSLLIGNSSGSYTVNQLTAGAGINITNASGAITISGAGTGNVSNVGTPTSGQIAQWTGATTIQGVSTTGTLGSVVLSNAPVFASYIDNTSIAAPSYVEGRLWYDSTQKALTYYNDVNNNAVTIGQETQVKVKNGTGSTINAGIAVYVTSTSSGQIYPNVAPAQANALSTSAVLGLTTASISAGATGYVTTAGLLTPVSTGSFTVGDVLYLSPYSAGQLQNTVPPTGYPIQIGVVAYSNSPNGSIYVKQTTPLTLAAATLTGTVSPANGGTGLSSIPANGQLLIGNGAGYTLGTLTAGPGVSITNAAGSVTIGSLIGQQSFFVQAYVDAAGSVWNASTDNTAPINACIAAASAAGGGTVVFPVGRGLALGAIVVPYAGTSGPTQVPLRLTGSGPTTNGYWNGSPNGGTILDLRYSGGGAQVAAIDTRGAGFLQIDNTTIVNGGSGNYQFFQTTNTTVHLDRVTWVGNSANSGTACVQNAILLGGNTSASSTLATNASTAGFQGYGSRITNCYFEHINVAVGFGGSANGVYLDNNTVSASCGSSASHGAPYVFYGAGLGTGGNVMNGGIVEITHYPYAVSMIDIGANNTQNYFFGLGSYDETMGSPTVGAFYFSANSIYNMVVPGFNDPGLPILNGPASASNSVMGSTIVNWSLNKGATFAGQLNTTAQMGVGNSNPQQRLDVGSGASFEAIRINGGNSGNGSGSAIEFSAGGSLSAYLGFYSGYGGGTYNSQMYFPTTISFGSSVAIGQTSGASPRVALDVGDGTGAKFASVDGAASGTGTGAGFEVRNGGAVLGFFGNQSAYTGGSYSATMLLEAFNGLVVAGNGGTYLTLNSGVFQINAGHLGFYGSSGLAQPTITGSKGGNAALASLLTYLAAMGLVVDSTT